MLPSSSLSPPGDSGTLHPRCGSCISPAGASQGLLGGCPGCSALASSWPAYGIQMPWHLQSGLRPLRAARGLGQAQGRLPTDRGFALPGFSHSRMSLLAYNPLWFTCWDVPDSGLCLELGGGSCEPLCTPSMRWPSPGFLKDGTATQCLGSGSDSPEAFWPCLHWPWPLGVGCLRRNGDKLCLVEFSCSRGRTNDCETSSPVPGKGVALPLCPHA